VQLAEGERSKRPAVAINLASQAGDILDGSQRAYLSPIRLNLEGREMYASDGEAIVGKLWFGEPEQVGIAEAARVAGLEKSDVEFLFPGKAELWVIPVINAHPDDPVRYEHPEGSLFAVIHHEG
jgi:hypothetical protein